MFFIAYFVYPDSLKMVDDALIISFWYGIWSFSVSKKSYGAWVYGGYNCNDGCQFGYVRASSEASLISFIFSDKR